MKIPISVLTVLLVLGLWTAAQAQAKPESKDRGKSAQAQLSKGPKIEKLGQTDADIV